MLFAELKLIGFFRTHVSFMMTFVDPELDGFSTEPTYATEASSRQAVFSSWLAIQWLGGSSGVER